MVAHKGFWLSTLLGLTAVAGLALAGAWVRSRPSGGCALDGAPIDPIYRVEIIDGRGETHAFCCVTCARLWLTRQPASPRNIVVTDETSGQPIDADSACFVRSFVVTRPTTGNRVHAFRSRADAEKHAEQFGGVVLSEAESPFAR
jgi:hypothetical protein